MATSSGSRLRPIYYEAEDGERWQNGWFDRELGARCEFAESEDGHVRCHLTNPIVSYTRSDCSVTGVVLGHGCLGASGIPPLAARFSESGASTCRGPVPGVRESYRVGGEIGERVSYSRSDAGSCVDGVYGAAFDAIRIPDVELVEATIISPEGAGGALARYAFTAVDGASGMLGLFDLGRGAGCARQGAMGPEPCLPLDTMRAGAGGPSCDQTWAWPTDPICDAGSVAVVPESACPPRSLVVLGVRDPIAAPAFGDECRPYTRMSTYETAPLDPGAFPTMTNELRGAGRLRARTWVNGAVDDFDPDVDGFYNQTRGEPCWPGLRISDGDVACVPSPNVQVDTPPRLFTDAECRRPAAARYCTDYIYVRPTDSDPCGPFDVQVFRFVGEPLDVYYQDVGFGCESPPPRAGILVFTVEAVPVDSFARLREIVD